MIIKGYILETPEKKSFFTRTIKNISDYFATTQSASKKVSDSLTSASSNQRINILKSYFDKGGKGTDLKNTNGNPKMFDSKTSSELSLFVKYGFVDEKGKDGKTMFELEASNLFKQLNKDKLDTLTINKLVILADNKANVPMDFGKSILSLQKYYPENIHIENLIKSVKKNNPQLENKFLEENKSDSLLLKAECSKLFQNLNKDIIDPKNIRNAIFLMKHSEMDENFAKNIVGLAELYPENKSIKSLVEAVKRAIPELNDNKGEYITEIKTVETTKSVENLSEKQSLNVNNKDKLYTENTIDDYNNVIKEIEKSNRKSEQRLG
jgi:prefoldin subunit 5